MAHSSNFNFTLNLSSDVYHRVQVHINGRPLEVTPEGFVMYRGDDSVHTFVIRADRRPQRHPAPYPVHAHVLSSQLREAERRRFAMTPFRHNSFLSDIREAPVELQDREYESAQSYGIRYMTIYKPNVDNYTQVRDAISDDAKDVCVICCSNYKRDQQIRVLICNHMYHKVCIDKWFIIQLNCPICRVGIDGNPHQDDEGQSSTTYWNNENEYETADSVISISSSSTEEEEPIVID